MGRTLLDLSITDLADAARAASLDADARAREAGLVVQGEAATKPISRSVETALVGDHHMQPQPKRRRKA